MPFDCDSYDITLMQLSFQMKKKSKKELEEILLSVGITREKSPGVRPLSDITKNELIELLEATIGGYRQI
jgi:hypothetical protein